MKEQILKDKAMDVLMKDADKIYKLIKNQQNNLCLACPAFEEVIDTQMFGFSKKVEFASNMSMISEEEGQLLLSTLEKHLNDVYNEAYAKINDNEE